jgi:hypothetical protein
MKTLKVFPKPELCGAACQSMMIGKRKIICRLPQGHLALHEYKDDEIVVEWDGKLGNSVFVHPSIGFNSYNDDKAG